ncbi:hypothetical protein PR048_010851 [Dryococelus australis]|uniref:Uncharacterized protein n=1 Tax=Dryococelus australis TaxID=614101 RepID=A0ABQ9I3X1_9NEOP|nr:hypothetical protein PR048_010851 [Dryococelus australis]
MERRNQDIKKDLHIRLQENYRKWVKNLPDILFTLCRHHAAALGASPSELLLGRPKRTRQKTTRSMPPPPRVESVHGQVIVCSPTDLTVPAMNPAATHAWAPNPTILPLSPEPLCLPLLAPAPTRGRREPSAQPLVGQTLRKTAACGALSTHYSRGGEGVCRPPCKRGSAQYPSSQPAEPDHRCLHAADR